MNAESHDTGMRSTPSRRIDLNADLGEGCGDDAGILACVSSANIACGAHAGNADSMRVAVQVALARGVAIGAHPGYFDPANFGRRELDLPLESVRSALLYQLGALDAIVRAEGGRLQHVKPHGALYNQAARDAALADTIAAAVRDFNAGLALVGLAGSSLIEAARRHGLRPVAEVFADRAYQPDGSLVPRAQAGALIEEEALALEQTLRLARGEPIRAIDGSALRMQADTICLHGDGAHALAFAQLLRRALLAEGFELRGTWARHADS